MKALRHWLVYTAQRFIRVLLDPTISPIVYELQRFNLPARDKATANPLLAYSRRYFSQNDEDGILLEILHRIDFSAPAAFIEFGVGDGTECNTIILLAKGWRGAWIGAERLGFDLPRDARLSFSKCWITRDNAVALVSDALSVLHLSLADVRVVSIDIDGNDGSVVRGLLAAGLAPDVFIVEYNGKFPPGMEFEMPYDEWHSSKRDDYQGVSLQRWASILLDYKLVTCNENGVNAFFVRNVHAARFTDVPEKIEELFRLGHALPYPRSGAVTSPRTVKYLATRSDMS